MDRPILMIVGGKDELYSENAMIFSHMGTNERPFIAFKDLDHMLIYDVEPVQRIAHFAVAFFGFYLQGQKKYEGYFSESFIRKHDGLQWGVID